MLERVYSCVGQSLTARVYVRDDLIAAVEALLSIKSFSTILIIDL